MLLIFMHIVNCTNPLHYLMTDELSFGVPVMYECFEVILAQHYCMLVHVLLYAFNVHACCLKLPVCT